MPVRVLLLALLLVVPPPGAALDPGSPLPAVTLPGRDGEPVALGALRGKVLLVDFWASWCAPCRESFPWFAQLHEELASRGLQVVAISLDQDRAEAERFLTTFPAPFTLLFDPDAKTGPLFALPAMPTSFVVGRDGMVRTRHAGFRERDRATLRAEIEAALAEPAP